VEHELEAVGLTVESLGLVARDMRKYVPVDAPATAPKIMTRRYRGLTGPNFIIQNERDWDS